MNIENILVESRFGGQGSREGRSPFSSKDATKGRMTHEVAKSQKSRVKVYDTIMDALKHGYVGQIFSTKGSKRLYVITRRKWGSSPQQEVNGKVAKGFSPGTIPSNWKDIKKYSARTMQRYGTAKSKHLKQKYAKNVKTPGD